jgi:hypothetical protein
MMRIAPFALVQTEVEGHGFIASPVARQKVIGDQMFQSSNGDGVCGGGGEPRQNESKAADDKPLSDASYKIQAGDFKAGGDLPVTIAFTANHGGAHMMSIACPAATDTSAQYKWTKMKLAASEKSQPHYWNGGAAAILGGGLEKDCPFRTKWAGFGSSYKVNPKGWDDKWCSKGGESGCYHIANPEAPDTVKTVWTIPADFKDCPHAVVQWNWMTFNSGKPAEFQSASICPDKAGRVLSETDISEAELRLLKDPYEQFKNCFDIKVGGGSKNNIDISPNGSDNDTDRRVEAHDEDTLLRI